MFHLFLNNFKSLIMDVQDIVDTTPYTKLSPVTADGLIKVLLGGINRRVDEFRNR
jgi:hypothetical protein